MWIGYFCCIDNFEVFGRCGLGCVCIDEGDG